jgi:translocation and assembly module TamB
VARFHRALLVERVTVSDAEGVWLELDGVEVVWTRTALFRRMLDIDSLRAERVTVLRKPVAGDVAGAEDSSGLPVEVAVDAFTLPLVTIAAPVAGAAAQLSPKAPPSLPREHWRRDWRCSGRTAPASSPLTCGCSLKRMC